MFIAVNELVSILGYFSDIGLAASLIQKKDHVTLTDLRTTFTLQQVLVLLLLLLTITVSPRLFSYYHISGGGEWLFITLLAAFFLASLKTIPSVILERQLRFEILAVVEIAETLMGRSHCPECRAKIRWYDNIPLLSYILLGTRCRHCQARIPFRYPLVELLTAVSIMLVIIYALYMMFAQTQKALRANVTQVDVLELALGHIGGRPIVNSVTSSSSLTPYTLPELA